MSARIVRPAVSLLVVMTALLGIAYPLVITGIAKAVFPRQAAGSLISNDGKLIGSSLIGQSFSDPKYFWGRPSATTPQPYNGIGSTGSNLGPLNPALIDAVKSNAKNLHDADPDNRRPVPVDLDSNPTKLIEIVETGKQMLMTRGALTTFSIANDVAKYFAIIPAAFAVTYPELSALNIMHLATPNSAILSAVIFNALIIVVLIPLAIKGVKYRPLGAGPLLRRNLLIYGLGGIVVPFPGIKLIDMLVSAAGWA